MQIRLSKSHRFDTSTVVLMAGLVISTHAKSANRLPSVDYTVMHRVRLPIRLVDQLAESPAAYYTKAAS